VVLVAYWLSLSGYFTAMLLTLGALSILVVLGLCSRMKIFDSETVPYRHVFSTLRYLVWLSKEIVKANVQVVKSVLSPDMEVSPTMVKIPAKDMTDLGATMFANSITLTPGTVSLAIDDDGILVHALLEEMSDAQGFEDMNARSTKSVSNRRLNN
jgi:multicomponent Na+:H+ antiporter subunit E